MLARKTPFTAAEYAAVAAHVRENPNLFWLNPTAEYAGLQPLPPAAKAFRDLIESNDPVGFARNYAYNVSPVSDSAPFFFFTLKTRHVIENILAGTGRGMDWRINLGVVVLGMLLIISIVAVLAFLILPLALHRHRQGAPKTGIVALLYFIAVGFGFILVEISLIQRFVLFLGHPTYALTVVVFLLLLSSGAGSVAARRRISSGNKILPLLGIIVSHHCDRRSPAAVAALSRHWAALRDQVASQRHRLGAPWLPHGHAFPHRLASGKDGGMGLGAQRCRQCPGISHGNDHRHPLWLDGHFALRRRSLPAGGPLLTDMERRRHRLERP